MTNTNKSKPLSAWNKAMDFLARRDHSEKELRDKLARNFDEDQIEQTVEEVIQRGWLLPPEELSQKVTESLHRKKKGYLSILHFLRQRGLPPVPKDEERELEKALQVLSQKAKNFEDIRHLSGLLKNRGFDTETISRTIHEIRRNPPSLY